MAVRALQRKEVERIVLKPCYDDYGSIGGGGPVGGFDNCSRGTSSSSSSNSTGFEDLSSTYTPNPQAMVAQLAQRLEANPNDLPGWLRLIRAYAVLGDKEKAAAALAKARSVFANEAQAQAQLGQAAQENALN